MNFCQVKSTLSQRHEEDEIIFGLSFSTFADSHLVCFEKDDGVFEPQAICRNQDGRRQCTGIGFILFGGNLCPSIEGENILSFLRTSGKSILEISNTYQTAEPFVTILKPKEKLN